jgi:phage terminase large subunit
MQLNISTLPHQSAFIKSTHKHTALIGGYGSGKTNVAIDKIIVKHLQSNGKAVAYYLPTFKLIKEVALERFPETFSNYGIEYTLNKSDFDIRTKYGKILLRNMSNPETIVGYETAYSLIDETDILPTDKMNLAFAKIIGRNRAILPEGQVNQTDVVGTPEGFKWLYDFFVKNPNPNKTIIKAKTIDNPFLPSDYIDNLKQTYTEAQVKAYINGDFINLKGDTVYQSYNRKAHRSDVVPLANEQLFVGLDFNIGNMNAVIFVKRNNVLYAVDEIAMAYNTQSICEILRTKYIGHKIIINPDASGNQRSTSGADDFSILRSNNFMVVSDKTNPAVSTRVNAVNIAFEKSILFVNDKKCHNFAEALENQAYRNGIPDKNGGYDHITEAAGYCINKQLFGMKPQST